MTVLRTPATVGVACAAAATALGMAYMAAAGAPAAYPAVNALALVLGLAGFAVLRPAGRAPRLPAWGTVALGALLLATAAFGASVQGASRWVIVGGLTLQVSLIALPAMLVAFAGRRDLPSTLGMALAAVALALQPDRAMAGVLAAGLAVLAVQRRDRWVLSALGVAAAGFAVTCVRPDTLPAVPYVDRILYTAFGVHALAGAAVVGGALLLVGPAVAGLRTDRANGGVHRVFGAVWLAIVAAAALGNYPTPLVGYGGSAILGYLASLSFLPVPAAAPAAVPARAPDAARTQGDGGAELRTGLACG